MFHLSPRGGLAALALAFALPFAGSMAAAADETDGWRVIAIGEEEITAEDGVTMNFEPGRISGRACNRYMGRVGLVATGPGEGEIFLGRLASTMMACQGRVGELERALHGALEMASHYRIDADGTLNLIAGDDSAVIRAVRF